MTALQELKIFCMGKFFHYNRQKTLFNLCNGKKKTAEAVKIERDFMTKAEKNYRRDYVTWTEKNLP